MSHRDNVRRIKTVVTALGDLSSHVVFVGGSTISFYVEEQSFEVRETDDVDIIVEVLTYANQAKLQEKLLQLGFSPAVDSSIRDRYRIKNVLVDVMPTTNIAMGFENKWYPEGFKNAISVVIDGEGTNIKILSPADFIATKLEAFKGRGNNHGRTSHDFEDIVYILENRLPIWDELIETQGKLRQYLKFEFAELMKQESIHEWIDCHVEMSSPPATDIIIQEIIKFIEASN